MSSAPRDKPESPGIGGGVLRRELKLIVEVDGATHGTAAAAAYDAARPRFLEASGYQVFRAHNSEVFENLDGVLETLLEVASRMKA